MDSIRRWRLAPICGAALMMCGCASGPNTTAGAAIGTGLGALTGAVIGSQTGHAGGGALIGAATGAVAGGLIGNAEDAREERDAAIAHAHAVEASNYAAAQAMTNYDLVMMTQSGVSDDVIVSAVNSRGGRFDLSPAAIVHLKQSGVSDRVVLAVQRAGSSGPAYPPATVVPAATYVPAPVTEVVVIPRRPVVGVGVVVGPRRHWHHHHHHGHWHRW